jgi:hypothetical protein
VSIKISGSCTPLTDGVLSGELDIHVSVHHVIIYRNDQQDATG